jgi:hypothetical protein
MDVEKEVDRLKAQITDTKEYIALLDRKLLNDSFVRNAPAKGPSFLNQKTVLTLW